MKTTDKLKPLLKQLEKHRNAIAKERDALRELQSEIADLLEPVECGVEALDDAISSFSEQA